MDFQFVLILVALVIFFISLRMQSKATQKLEISKKEELIKHFSTGRLITFLPLIGVLIIFYLNLKYQWIDPYLMNYIFFGILLLFMILNTIKNYRKLKDKNFSDWFIKQFLVASTFRLIAFFIFIYVIMGLSNF